MYQNTESGKPKTRGTSIVSFTAYNYTKVVRKKQKCTSFLLSMIFQWKQPNEEARKSDASEIITNLWEEQISKVKKERKKKKKKTTALSHWDLRYNDLPIHPPYSPDLAPSDFYLSPNLKKFVTGKHFTSNEVAERAIDEYFNSLPDSRFQEGILILEKFIQKNNLFD